jgi:hypothetical protein
MGFPAHKAGRALDEKGNYLGAAIEYASAMPDADEPAPLQPRPTSRAAPLPEARGAAGPCRAQPQAEPFPISFAVAILSAGRDRTAPRHDLEQLRGLCAAEHARQCREQSRELALGTPPELLGLASRHGP